MNKKTIKPVFTIALAAAVFSVFAGCGRSPQAEYKFGMKQMESKNYAEAVKSLRKAAEQGLAAAQNDLGNSYYNGNGVRQDYWKAVNWYRKAAEQGHAVAQYNLGVCYYNGNGVPQDMTEAVNWYRKAAAQGLAVAQYNLGVCYYNGNGVPQDYGKAVNCYCKAAAQGHAGAQNNLRLCYNEGKGVPKDYAKDAKRLKDKVLRSLKSKRDQDRKHSWYKWVVIGLLMAFLSIRRGQ